MLARVARYRDRLIALSSRRVKWNVVLLLLMVGLSLFGGTVLYYGGTLLGSLMGSPGPPFELSLSAFLSGTVALNVAGFSAKEIWPPRRSANRDRLANSVDERAGRMSPRLARLLAIIMWRGTALVAFVLFLLQLP